VIRKVIVPAAGYGRRLLPATKERPKEMLPIFSPNINGEISLRPVVQVVYEQLYDAGLREYCFVVGREKRSLENHFTPDADCIRLLEDMGEDERVSAADLKAFYKKLRTSNIMWTNQIEAKGFGSAVLTAQPFVQNEYCLVHAGDSCMLSKKINYIKLLIEAFDRFGAEVAFLVIEIENPKQYGIMEGNEIKTGIFKVSAVNEKPEKPQTNLAIMAMYAFHPVIFKALEETQPDRNGEIQLTDAIQKIIDWDLTVIAAKMDADFFHIDVGNPERYFEALSLSHSFFQTLPKTK
jgi:UTP--glucose-1-phosphate uridylyltransferase